MNKFCPILAMSLVLCCITGALHEASAQQARYHSPDDINARIQEIAGKNKNVAAVHKLGRTPGDRDILLLELGKKTSGAPAILVVGNMEGDCPVASEAALRLSELLVGEWGDELESRRYYIVPTGNPDGYSRFFERPLWRDSRNARPYNDDNDDAVDEDGPEDLNGDGYITMMRQKHFEGKWISIEGNPVLMKIAEAGKGEKGVYRMFSEGIDNDGDGLINEDGPGGANPGRNFPHAFRHYTESGGRWAASEPETRALMEFAFAHPEIAMVLSLGRTNSLKNVPESSKKSEAGQDAYKIPEYWAAELGMDPEIEYPISELIEMGKAFTGFEDLTEEMVLRWLGAGAAVNPDGRDLTYWSEISNRYGDFIKEAGLDGERLDPPVFSPGCIEEWAYYQYGVPSFSMDFWTLPIVRKQEEKEEGVLSPEEIENMSDLEFIDLGNERITEFLKASKAPAYLTADMVVMGLKSGMMTTRKMAEMMRKMKKQEEAGGADETEQALYDYDSSAFVRWQPYDHPTLGEVEIGGMIPFSDLTPPADSVEELLMKQLPFVRVLAGLLPRIKIENVEVKRMAQDVWKIDAWVMNDGFLPYPTWQGQRCERPTPVIVTLAGESIRLLEGRDRCSVGLLDGSGGVGKVSWLLSGREGGSVRVKAHTMSAGTDEQVVILRGGGK